METGAQESAVNKKLLALVSVVLALLLVAICYVGFLLILSYQTVQPAQQQLAQTEIPLSTSVKPVVQFLPVVANWVVPAPAPAAITVPTPTLWRFVSINDNDIGTFENVGDPSQRLAAKCKDPKRPAPDKGELYKLDDAGILKPQEGSKKFQRFELITRE
jgi:hypothetical protein